MAVKTTKTENFSVIRDILAEMGRDDLVSVMEHEIELIAKKNARKGNSAKNVENENLKVAILNEMEEGEKYLVSEMTENFDSLAEYRGKNQKITALVTQLLREGKLSNCKEKGKSYYSLVPTSAE